MEKLKRVLEKWDKPEPDHLFLKLVWGICAFTLCFGVLAYVATILMKVESKLESFLILIPGIPIAVGFVFVGAMIVMIFLNRLFYHIVTPFYEWISSLFSNKDTA